MSYHIRWKDRAIIDEKAMYEIIVSRQEREKFFASVYGIFTGPAKIMKNNR